MKKANYLKIVEGKRFARTQQVGFEFARRPLVVNAGGGCSTVQRLMNVAWLLVPYYRKHCSDGDAVVPTASLPWDSKRITSNSGAELQQVAGLQLCHGAVS